MHGQIVQRKYRSHACSHLLTTIKSGFSRNGYIIVIIKGFALLFEVTVLFIVAMVDYGMYYSGDVDVETGSAQIMGLNWF